MTRWLEPVRSALAYWRDFETVLRIIAAGVVVVGLPALVLAWVGTVPGWLVAALLLTVWLFFGTGATAWIAYRRWRTTTQRRSLRTPLHDPLRYREYGGVLWHLAGGYVGARTGARADGPLCPVDRATLSFQGLRYSNEGVREVQESDLVSGHHGQLVCPDCSKTYTFPDLNASQIGTVRGLVERAFEGDIRSGRVRV